jgi:hypothetical protein
MTAARALLCPHKFAAAEVGDRLGEQDGHLERKDVLTVDVLVPTRFRSALALLAATMTSPRVAQLFGHPSADPSVGVTRGLVTCASTRGACRLRTWTRVKVLILSTNSDAFLRYLAMFSSGSGSGFSVPSFLTISDSSHRIFIGGCGVDLLRLLGNQIPHELEGIRLVRCVFGHRHA